MRSLLSAVIASVIIITAYVLIPLTPQTAPLPYETAKPVPTTTTPPPVKAAATAPAAEQPKVSVDSLEIDLAEPNNKLVRTNQVRTRVKLSLKGTAKTNYRAEISVDDKVALVRDIAVLPGTQEEIFVVNINDLGKHKISLGGKSYEFRIVEPGLPVARKELKYATIVYNHGIEDALQYIEKNIEIAYTNVPRRLKFSDFNDRLTVYVYITRDDTFNGISTIGKAPVLAERYYKLGLFPEPIDDVMHGGSASILTCLNLFTSWAMKKKGFYALEAEWLAVGIAEYLSYDIGREYDRDAIDAQFKARVQRLKTALDEGKLLKPQEMENRRVWEVREEDKELGTLERDEAHALVHYIAKNWGFVDGCLEIVKARLRGNPTSNSVRIATGLSYENLESALRKWITDQSKLLEQAKPK